MGRRGSEGGGGSSRGWRGRRVGGHKGGCERRSEAFVKIKKKLGGGSRDGS